MIRRGAGGGDGRGVGAGSGVHGAADVNCNVHDVTVTCGSRVMYVRTDVPRLARDVRDVQHYVFAVQAHVISSEKT